MMRGDSALCALVACLCLAAAAPAPACAQVQPSAASADVTLLEPPSWPGRFDVVTRTRATVAGVAVALPVGSSVDPSGSEGAGWILADAVALEIESRLGAGQVEASARVEPERTTFSFVVRTDAVAELLDTFRAVAFGTGPGSDALRSALDQRIADLVFQQDSPVRDVGRAARALIYGSGEDRVHAPGGTLGSVETLDAAMVDRVRREGYRPEFSVVSVVGALMEPRTAAAPSPAAITDSTSASGGVATDTPAPAAVDESVAMRAGVPAPTTSSGAAWTEGSRQSLENEVTNTWITVAWPVPGSLSRIDVDFIAHRMDQELNPSPPDPGVFSADVEIMEMPEGEILVVRAAVLPRQADAMETRILSLPGRLSTPPGESFFLWYRRQFRADRLVADAPPEAAARRRAREILARGAALDVASDVWTLTPDGIADTARALGQPRVLVFGPPRGDR